MICFLGCSDMDVVSNKMFCERGFEWCFGLYVLEDVWNSVLDDIRDDVLLNVVLDDADVLDDMFWMIFWTMFWPGMNELAH